MQAWLSMLPSPIAATKKRIAVESLLILYFYYNYLLLSLFSAVVEIGAQHCKTNKKIGSYEIEFIDHISVSCCSYGICVSAGGFCADTCKAA